MTAQIDSQTFAEQALVVTFSDLTGFWRFSRARPAPQSFPPWPPIMSWWATSWKRLVGRS